MKNTLVVIILLLPVIFVSLAYSAVVINEVFYDPQWNDQSAVNKEFVELYNNGPDPVCIGGYKIQAAGSFWETNCQFHPNTIIPSDSYLLVGEGLTFSVTPDVLRSLRLQNGNYDAYYEGSWHSVTGPVDGVRLLDADSYVLDCLLYNPEPSGNQNNLDTTGWGNETAYEDVPSGYSISRVTAGVDNDLLSDWVTLTDPTPQSRGALSDSDGDGIPDIVEDEIGSSPTNTDTDSDGLLDGEELKNWNFTIDSDETDPTDSDTDDDDLSDGLEVNTYYTQPRKPDTDGDTLLDGAEVNTHGTSPIKKDTDLDGYSDNQEINYGTVPTNTSSHPKIVINEVYYDHPGRDEGKEYIVLFNPENYDVDLTGFRIESGGTKFLRNVSFSQNTTIPSGCFYLIGEENVLDINLNQPDLIHWLKLQNGDQNDPDAYYYEAESPTDGVRLTGPYLDGTKTVLDTVLWDEDNTNCLPGDAHDPAQSDEFIPDVEPGHALRRSIVGYDTDSKNDWEEIDPRPVSAASGTDPDNDGLSNIEESWNHTDPTNSDTDDDGTSDGMELTLGLNPTLNEASWSSLSAETLSWPTDVTIFNTKFGSRLNFDYLFDLPGDHTKKDEHFGHNCVRTGLYGAFEDKKQNFTVALRIEGYPIWKFPLTFQESADFSSQQYFSDIKIDIGLTYSQISGIARSGNDKLAEVSLKTICPFTPTSSLGQADNMINYGPFIYHDITINNLSNSAISGDVLVALDGAVDSDLSIFDGKNYRIIYFHNDPVTEYSYKSDDETTFTQETHRNDGNSGYRSMAIDNGNTTWRIGTEIYDDFEADGELSNQAGEGPGGIAFPINLAAGFTVQTTIIYAGYLDETVPRQVFPENDRYYYYYTVNSDHGFTDVDDVLDYAIAEANEIRAKTDNFEDKLNDAKLSSKWKWIIAQSFHSYLSNTCLFRNQDDNDAPRWYFMEGSCGGMNTLDVGYETEIFTGYEVPWVLKLNLEQWSHATYTTDTEGNQDGTDYTWLHHAIGAKLNVIYNGGGDPPDRSFRLEENLNYVLMSYWYWNKSGDDDFFRADDFEKLDFIWTLLQSSIAADRDEDGIADAYDFLGGDIAVTTYDTPGISGGLARPFKNTYIGVKQMAAYIAADKMFSSFGVHTDDSWTCFSQATIIRNNLKILYSDGNRKYIPVSFAEGQIEYKSPVIPEGLLYLALTDTTSPILDSKLLSILEDNYKTSYQACETNHYLYGNCVELTTFEGQEPTTVSWLSKILNEDYVSQHLFGYKTDSNDFIFRSLTDRPRAWSDAWNYSCDPVFSGLSLYPRGICSWIFLMQSPQFKYYVLESGDYNGDGSSDIANFRPQNNLWAIRDITWVYFGDMGDIPVSGDYDGNGTTEIAVFRPSSGLWWIKDLTRYYQFGQEGDIPAPGDYDGDGSCEAVVFRQSTGLWTIRNITWLYHGTRGDIPVPEDYDGDGCADIAIFRPSSKLWAIRNQSNFYFGINGDSLAPGDYDGDGTAEAAVFRDRSSLWSIRNLTRVYYGSVWDRAVAADYDGDGSADTGIFRPAINLWAIKNITRCFYGEDNDIKTVK